MRFETFVPPVAAPRITAVVPAAFARWQTARSCENVCGTVNPSCLNNPSFVKIANGRTFSSKPNRPCPDLLSDSTSGSDLFTHGAWINGARYPDLASTQ